VEESELLSSKPLIHLESIEDYIGKCNPQTSKVAITAILLKHQGSRFFSGLHSFYGIWRIEDCPI